jgi:hypothetical protein
MALDLTSPQVVSAEFNEKLSQELLLQPDAMYPFARMLYSARIASAMQAFDAGLFDLAKLQALDGRLQEGSGPAANLLAAMSNGMGGPLDLSTGLQWPDMVKVVQDAASPGLSIKINRPTYLDGSTSASARTASPSTKLFGTNSQPIHMDQVTVGIVEYLGPTLSDGTIAPISLPRYTMHRSAHDLLVDVGAQLRRDWMRFIDAKMRGDLIAAAKAASEVTFPEGVTGTGTTGGFTGANNEPMSFDLLVNAAKALKDRFIPGIAGAPRYLGVLPTNQVAQLKLDPQYQRLSVYEPQYNPLFPGYVRTVDNIIVVENNNMDTILGGVGTAVTLYQGLVMAPNAYGWAVAEDVRALRNPNDDGGRSNEFGWSHYGGLAVLDDRFVQCIITD